MGIHSAAFNGDLEIVDLLLERGFDVNRRSADATALHYAAEGGYLPVVQRLVSAGADLHALDDQHGFGVVGWAACFAPRVQVADYLLEQGAQADIFEASALGRVDLVRKILDEDPSQLMRRSRLEQATPLHFAVEKNHEGVAELLLERGADPLVKDYKGRTAVALLRGAASSSLREQLTTGQNDFGFFEALAAGHWDLAEELFKKDPGRLQVQGADYLAIPRATTQGLLQAVRWLLAHGADVNARAKGDCNTVVLHEAAFDGKLALIRLLLDSGAAPTLRDERWNATPASWAAFFKQPDAEGLLRQAEETAQPA